MNVFGCNNEIHLAKTLKTSIFTLTYQIFGGEVKREICAAK